MVQSWTSRDPVHGTSIPPASDYLYAHMHLSWNMDFSLVAVGTVFPLTYTISQAYGESKMP